MMLIGTWLIWQITLWGAGANDFLTKTVDFKLLKENLKQD